MIIQSRKVWVAGQFIPAQLLIEGGAIRGVLPHGAEPPDEDHGAKRVIPGFMDLHTHGAYGFDTNDAAAEGLRAWAKSAPGEGVTSFTPTTVTQSDAVLTAAVECVAQVAAQNPPGAELVGIHMEGPYLCRKYKGAQPPEFIVPPSAEQLDRWQRAAKGMIRLITIAPEQDRDFALTKHCRGLGIAVNMGHTDATYEQALLAVANGVTGVTHTHNAMSPYHHRDTGVVNVALRCGGVYSELIPDGIHVAWPVVETFYRCKGAHYGITVTDSLLIKGTEGGDYSFGGHAIEARPGGGAVLKGTNTIAGSTLKYNEGLRNLVEEALVPFEAALNSCTVNPARHIGLAGRKGLLAAGYDADLVVLEDDYRVARVFCRGKEAL